MCSFGSCQTRFEFLSQFRKVRNAFECFVTQVQTHLPKTKRVWPMKINVICTVYRLRVTLIFLYIFSFHPTVKVKVNATLPVHLLREHLICSSRHKREPFSHALIFPAQTFPRWQPHRYIQSTLIIYHEH